MAPIDGPIDVAGTVFKISPAGGSPSFTLIQDVTGHSSTRSKGGNTTKTRVYGRSLPYVKSSNDPTTTFALSGLLNLGDTNGQNVLAAAYYSDADLLIQALPDGVNGEQYTGKVTEYNDSGSADGQFVTVAFTFVASSGHTTVTGS